MERIRLMKAKAARAVLLKDCLALSGDGSDAHTILALGSAIEDMAKAVLTFQDFQALHALASHGLTLKGLEYAANNDLLAFLPSEKYAPKSIAGVCGR